MVKEQKIDDDRDKSIYITVKEITKKFGENIYIKINEDRRVQADVYPTGIFSLDDILGVGGLPKGRIIEIYGPESGGKTTLALQILGEIQKANYKTAFIDIEFAFNKDYSESLGVNTDNLLLFQPDYGEQALDIVSMLAHNGSMNLIVIDSVAALVPKAELEGDIGDARIGLQGKMMSQACRVITGALARSQCTCIFINQLRDSIGDNNNADHWVSQQRSQTVTGGQALRFYATIRLDIHRGSQESEGTKSDKEFVGRNITITVQKNKLATPFKKASFYMEYGSGISKAHDVFNMAMKRDIITVAGSWYSYNGKKLGQGKDSIIERLKTEQEFYEEIRSKLLIKE